MSATAHEPGTPTRDPGELRAALTPEDRSRLGKHCERIVGSLGRDEAVLAIASCVSGKPGLVAVSDHQLLFVYKPDAVTPARVSATKIEDMAALHVVSDAQLNVKSSKTEKVIGYKQLSPECAHELAELLWDLGVPRPVGHADAETPSELLPTSSPDVLLQTLRDTDREVARPLVDRVCASLGPGEDVRLASVVTSRAQLLLALTNKRLLWSALQDGRTTLAGVEIRHVLAIRADHGAILVANLHSKNLPEIAVREMRPALAQSFVDGVRELGGADEAVLAKFHASMHADQSALNVLPSKTRRVLQGHIGSSEPVFLVLVGGFGQALIALSDRIVIAKAGLMSGNTFGGKVTAFPYREVTGIEIHTGFSTGVLGACQVV